MYSRDCWYHDTDSFFEIIIHRDLQITLEFTFIWFEIDLEVHTIKCEAQFVIEIDFVQMFSVFQKVVEYCAIHAILISTVRFSVISKRTNSKKKDKKRQKKKHN